MLMRNCRHFTVVSPGPSGAGRAILRLLLAALTLWLSGCQTREAWDGSHEDLSAVLWAQTSAEYAASALQAYRLAAVNLDLALADPHWTAALEQRDAYTGLPPAVIIDLDQTVLDTSRYNARIILEFGGHSNRRFAEWCRDSTAPAIPGAKGFLDHAAEQGVTVIYISARAEASRDCTTRNLQALGLPLERQQHLLLNDGTPSTRKTLQRARVAAQYRVLLLVGDDLNDFVSGAKSDPDTRRALLKAHAGRWGREWVVLPNPMFGSWEASLYGFDHSLLRDERLHRVLPQLQR